MPKLVFFRQKRVDDSIRTGVELDGETLAELFEESGEAHDPALRWYVDLRCEGKGIPGDGDDAWSWLLKQSSMIREGFTRCSEDVRAGTDRDIYSLIWEGFRGQPTEVSMKIACSALKRVDAREMSSVLAEMGEHWDLILESIDLPVRVEEVS